MPKMADPGYKAGFYTNPLLALIRAFETVKVVDDAGRCFFDRKGFIVFDGTVGFNIDDNTFLQRGGADGGYAGGRRRRFFFSFGRCVHLFRRGLLAGGFLRQFSGFGK